MGLRSAVVATAVCSAASALAMALIVRRRKQARGQMCLEKSDVDLGGCFGMDAGGTLSKLVYFEATNRTHEAPIHRFITASTQYGETGERDEHLRVHSDELGGDIHFIHFETAKMAGAVDLVAAHGLQRNLSTLYATGGGAFKYSKLLSEALAVQVVKVDELETLMKGIDFLVRSVPGEVYTWVAEQPTAVVGAAVADKKWRKEVRSGGSHTFPYLLVNIGSGVSILKVSAPGQYERVSGSSVGGGTYLGLARLLTPDAGTFTDVLNLAERGDNLGADMTVGDIYGGDYSRFGLRSELVASSFGKLVGGRQPGLREQDIALSLLTMITNNIGQIAYLNAQLHQTRTIYFVGNFLRHNLISARALAHAIGFWSSGAMEAQFLEHEGYFGALGAMLTAQPTHSSAPVRDAVLSPELGPSSPQSARSIPELKLPE